jgi:hypothetical protein
VSVSEQLPVLKLGTEAIFSGFAFDCEYIGDETKVSASSPQAVTRPTESRPAYS